MANGIRTATPVDSIKDVVQSSVKVPVFDKYLKKAERHIGRNVVEITIKMKKIVRKPLMIKIPLLFFYKYGFGIRWPMKVDMALNKETNQIRKGKIMTYNSKWV